MSGEVARRLHVRAGEARRGAYELEITQAGAGWDWSSLRVLRLEPGRGHTFATREEEMVVLPLSGACTVTCDGEAFELAGRRDVFSRVTDCAYVPRDAEVTVTSAAGGRFAFPGARCDRRLAARYRAAEDVRVEVRGAGVSSRQINNFCSADSFDADRLIAVEVLTPGGNWSSYPPHKHDEDRPGVEAALEEIYYFETRSTEAEPGGSTGGGAPRVWGSTGGGAPRVWGSTGGGAPRVSGFALMRVYGTEDRPIDVLAEVGDGDVVLVPHGWHGPAIAAPGYDLYYLNVMAGPGPDRLWLICDDPAHAWVKQTWADQDVDPRLPMTSAGPRTEGSAS